MESSYPNKEAASLRKAAFFTLSECSCLGRFEFPTSWFVDIQAIAASLNFIVAVIDFNSNLRQFTTRGGGTISYTYDALNQVVTKSPSGQAVVSYFYDLAGRITTTSVPPVSGDPSTGAFQQSYDTAGRFYQETFPDPSGLALTVALTLDANGNTTKITYPDGVQVSRPHDQLNRVTSISDTSGSITFGYDNLSRRTLQTVTNNLTRPQLNNVTLPVTAQV